MAEHMKPMPYEWPCESCKALESEMDEAVALLRRAQSDFELIVAATWELESEVYRIALRAKAAIDAHLEGTERREDAKQEPAD